MDKPISMSVKDYLMRLMSIRTNTPLKTIEAVISHQFESANQALKSNFTLEISGFGKLSFSHKKAQMKWEKNLSKKDFFENALKDPSISEQKRKSIQLKLDNTIKWIEQIRPKIEHDKHQSNIRRMEKQLTPTREPEDSNK